MICPTCGSGHVPPLGARERWRVCIHEAGHVLVGLLSGARVTRASVGRDGALAGSTMVDPTRVAPSSWRAIWGAGAAAEAVEFGGVNYDGCGDDFQKIRASALDRGHDQGDAVEAAIREAEALLRPRVFDLFAFAYRLHQAGTLSAAEIETVARQLGLRPAPTKPTPSERPLILAPRPARYGVGPGLPMAPAFYA